MLCSDNWKREGNLSDTNPTPGSSWLMKIWKGCLHATIKNKQKTSKQTSRQTNKETNRLTIESVKATNPTRIRHQGQADWWKYKRAVSSPDKNMKGKAASVSLPCAHLRFLKYLAVQFSFEGSSKVFRAISLMAFCLSSIGEKPCSAQNWAICYGSPPCPIHPSFEALTLCHTVSLKLGERFNRYLLKARQMWTQNVHNSSNYVDVSKCELEELQRHV